MADKDHFVPNVSRARDFWRYMRLLKHGISHEEDRIADRLDEVQGWCNKYAEAYVALMVQRGPDKYISHLDAYIAWERYPDLTVVTESTWDRIKEAHRL
jgi:hypothetical protein